MTERIRVELLIGRVVHDRDGRKVGRIEAIHAHRTQRDCLVDEFVVGPAALGERFGRILLFHALGIRLSRHEPTRIPWRELDLSDPRQPRLRISLDELRALQETLPPRR